jgi:hypothetical protein
MCFIFMSKSSREHIALTENRYYSYSKKFEDRIQNTVDRIKYKKRKQRGLSFSCCILSPVFCILPYYEVKTMTNGPWGGRDRPSRPRQDQFKEFEATELYCSKCRRAVPVRKRLLLVLPEGDKYEYRCALCGNTVGDKLDKTGQYFGVLRS